MKSESKLTVDSFGNKYWKNEYGERHRLDGPAFENTYGDKWWYLNGNLHREDGPAFETVHGTKEWWLNGLRHRLNGPAFEHANGTRYWFYHGKIIDCQFQEEFERIIELLPFE